MPVNVRRPSESSGSFVPEDFDDTFSYRVQLTDLEERPSTQPKSKPGDTYLRWHLTPYDRDGVAFLDPNTGGPLDVFANSPLGLWTNAATGERAKAREMAEAFLGGEVSDEEMDAIVDQGFREPLLDKWAMATFEVQRTQGGERLGVLKLRPIRKAPSRMPQQQAIPPRQRNVTPPPEDDEQ